MPIHEYHCEPCDHTFETLIRSSSDVPRCPRCGEIDLKKQFSVPSAARNASAGLGVLPSCSTPAPSFGGGCGAGGCGSGMCGMG